MRAEEHLSLVKHVMRKHDHWKRCRRVDREDVLSAGYVGLVRACQTFQPRRGVQFSTYAVVCIRNSIGEYLRRERAWYARWGGARVPETPAPETTADFDLRDWVETTIPHFDPRCAEILRARLAGLDWRDTGARVRLSRQQALNILNKFGERLVAECT